MQKWSLQDIRPTGHSHTAARGQIHTRPVARRRAPAREQEEDLDTFQEREREEDFSGEENLSDDEEVSSERIASSRVRSIGMNGMSDVRSRRAPIDEYEQGDGSPEVSYGHTAPLPRALRGQGTPINPTPVRLYIRIAAFVLLASAIISFFVMNAYSSATVTIMPKALPVTVDAILSASIDGAGLRFSTIDYVLESEVNVAADGVEDVSELASGYVTISNAFSESAFPLIKNTRFETADKKIFRIQESVKVPGYTKKDGAIIPGTVVARVFADTPGEAGNIAATRFTVPGFAGEPEFEKIYAESSEAFTGGIVGKQSIVSDQAKAEALAGAQDTLAKQLRQYAIDQRPAGQVLYVEGVRITYAEMPPTPTADEAVASIVVRAKLSAPIFALEDISREIAKSAVVGYAGEEYIVQNPSILTFAYVGNATSTDNNIAFTLSGDAVLIQAIDKEALKKDLVGISKRDIMSIVTKYPMVERVSYDLKPAWRQSFPEDSERITFDIITPE